MPKRSTAWKGFERRTAEAINGKRRPVTGLDRGDGDVFTAMFEIQCKCRGVIPSYLTGWLAGIRRTAAARGRIGVVVWKQPGQGRPDAEALVVMRFADFVDLHGTPKDIEAERLEDPYDA